MKKIFLIIFIIFYSSQVFAAGPAPTDKEKTTVSTGVKPSTKYSAGKKWVSKAKKFEKKNKQIKAKSAYEKAIKIIIEAKSRNPGDTDTCIL